MGVYELSGAGSIKTGRTLYTSMNANNQFGSMVPITHVNLSGSSSNTVVSNIPQNYQDLRIVFTARLSTTETTSGFYGFLLNDTGTVYSTTTLDGTGSSATSSRSTNSANGISIQYMGGNAAAGIVAANTIDIFNYASTTAFKTALTRSAGDSSGAGQVRSFVTAYRTTAPISQMTLTTSGFTWGNGSTFTLYGIRAVSS
jgi:hypothetical protein